MNATIEKFGYPQSLLHESEHWVVLLRPQQVTLGALVLCSKSGVSSLGKLEPFAFADMGLVIARVEQALMVFRPFDKINFLALMMVDPHVHFHVLPRYAEPQDFHGISALDAGWPALPDLKSDVALTASQRAQLLSELLDAFRQAG